MTCSDFTPCTARGHTVARPESSTLHNTYFPSALPGGACPWIQAPRVEAQRMLIWSSRGERQIYRDKLPRFIASPLRTHPLALKPTQGTTVAKLDACFDMRAYKLTAPPRPGCPGHVPPLFCCNTCVMTLFHLPSDVYVTFLHLPSDTYVTRPHLLRDTCMITSIQSLPVPTITKGAHISHIGCILLLP
jgi:hypothetical protein